MQQITLAEASKHLAQLIDAALRGEEIIILKDNQPVVKLAPLKSPQNRHPKFGSARGLITVSDDFDEPLEDFRKYME